ncbi:MAG: ABC transporter ATP-binding protein [Ferrovibrionaceae bacterium]
MADIVFDGIEKRFGTVAAVARFDLDIGHGEFVVLVGPSGCGKTTSLRMLAGLEQPTAGRIRLGPDDITDRPPRERNIAMVFQSYALYPHMTVAENIGFSLRLKRMGKREIAAEVAQAAATMGIEGLLERKPRELSGGQRQRVAVCRAIVRRPQAFLFDEPLSNLDARLRASARAEIRTLQQRLGVTAVYVTHDQVEAMTMADRMVVMKDGHIQQIGRPLDVYAHPANAFVAGFIGAPAMNLLPLARAPFAAAGPADALVGVRPEDIRLDPASCIRPQPFQARLRHVEALGAESLLHLDHEGLALQMRLPGSWQGAELPQFFVDAARLHLFCGRTGARLPASV